MPMPQEYRDQLLERHLTAEAEARRATRRDLLRTCGHLVFWVACGLVLFGLAFHTDNYQIGMVFWWAAHAVWLSGVAFSLLAAYRRGEKRGDW